MSKFIDKNCFDSGIGALFALCLPLIFIGFEPIKWVCLLVICWFLLFVAIGQLLLFCNELFEILGINSIIPNLASSLFDIAHLPVIVWCYPGMFIVRGLKRVI